MNNIKIIFIAKDLIFLIIIFFLNDIVCVVSSSVSCILLRAERSGTNRQTDKHKYRDITTYRLNWPRGRLSEKHYTALRLIAILALNASIAIKLQ